LIVVIVIVWFVLVGISFVFFSLGDDQPGDGRGETIESSAGR
jgi:hypothetical protein